MTNRPPCRFWRLSTVYAETGAGRVKPLSGEFDGLLRLRVGGYRVLFDETEDEIIVHRVRDRGAAYR